MEYAEHHSRELRDRGITKLDHVLSSRDVRVARQMIFGLAEEHGLLKDGFWAIASSRFGIPKPFRGALNALNRSDVFPSLIGEEVRPLVEQLIGQSVSIQAQDPQILFSLPSKEEWVIPADVWHLDLPRQCSDYCPGLQVFTFLDDVEPKGGGTLVLAGSHRFCNASGRLSSKEVKQRLRQDDYFHKLFDPARPAITSLEQTRGSCRAVNLEVVELSGHVGDVYLMDLRVLHTPAQNSSDKARMMLTCRFPLTGISPG